MLGGQLSYALKATDYSTVRAGFSVPYVTLGKKLYWIKLLE